jgi:hypothetical protein
VSSLITYTYFIDGVLRGEVTLFNMEGSTIDMHGKDRDLISYGSESMAVQKH